MRPEQEKVKNLLTDTVTLLCKNGLTYQDELRVEALIAITLDTDDVFIVHINEKFDSNGEKKTLATRSKETDRPEHESLKIGYDRVKEITYDDPASSTEERAADAEDQGDDRNDLQADALPEEASHFHASSSQNQISDTQPSQGEDSDPGDANIVIKIEDDEEEPDGYISALQSPNAVAQRATMVAGQRRVPTKRHHSQSHDTEIMQQSYSHIDSSMRVTEDGSYWNPSHTSTGEPLVKRQSLNSSLDYYAMGPDQGEMPHVPFSHDTGDGQVLPLGGSRAGCSSWPMGAGLQRTNQQADMVSLLPHFFFVYISVWF